ncbi:isocitrate lyase/phosphoenolpyruvate mutase family protein [Catenulispora sp. NF23]|uniref:Isocitrate lyase/phosphoenolpyruvate mutase family protein n=1 Tax=Catenulispora pinistramenti TaxID=2705254 RepID=A0ABS5KL87_9ACTN|nr:isocitrate lyase/phosphoenolpyruvate mutase family protein [Catenulispora pinistramenti]MBS2531526.1 isocitrate lyase/phosphoenolpyruvate mutase family protein [Catenulispora pinistramenti]MBS2546795.1 isocitrate lyase/phosphoenolpyruvate mutase family protein [Catenulispora pinistramenti]
MLSGPSHFRIMGAHDGLTAKLAENAGFEAIWAGGLGISSSYLVPDAGLLTMTEFVNAAAQMRAACTLPIIADVDAGFGDVNVVRRMVRLYEAAGIDAVCIEDKQYPKRNSFRGGQHLEEPRAFAQKIATAKAAQCDTDFVVVARLESLIAGAGMDDALSRAELYHDAGADAVLIHSRLSDAGEIREFCRRWQATGRNVPVLCVPTTYAGTTATELGDMGIRGIIYANHAIRVSVKAVTEVLASIAKHDSTAPIEYSLASLSDLFGLIGMNDVLNDVPWEGAADSVEAR